MGGLSLNNIQGEFRSLIESQSMKSHSTFRVCAMKHDNDILLDLSVDDFIEHASVPMFDKILKETTSICCYSMVPSTYRTYDVWSFSLDAGCLLFEYFEQIIASPSGSSLVKGKTKLFLVPLSFSNFSEEFRTTIVDTCRIWKNKINEDCDFNRQSYNEFIIDVLDQFATSRIKSYLAK